MTALLLLAACGDGEAVPAQNHIHLFSEWTDEITASCGADGKQIRTCTCGERQERTVSATGTHIFGEWEIKTPQTCLSDGLLVRFCVCGKSEEKAVLATGIHTFGDWRVKAESSCAEEGVSERRCYCGFSEEKTIPKTESHIFGTDNKCTVCGHTVEKNEDISYIFSEEMGGYIVTGAPDVQKVSVPPYYEKLPVVGIADGAFAGKKNLVEVTLPDSIASIGARAFADCESLVSVKYYEPKAVAPDAFDGCALLIDVPHVHFFENPTVVFPAGCISEGSTQSTCKCGRIKTEKIIPTGKHAFGEWVLVSAGDCTDGGEKKRECECGYSESEKIEPTGHTLGEWTDEIAPTCEEKGVRGHYKCELCKKHFDADGKEIPDVSISPLGHELNAWIPEVSPTETEDGIKGHYRCSCGKNLDLKGREITDLTIPALGNDEGEWDHF